MKRQSVIETVLDGLEQATPEGRGFGVEHLRAVKMANAAPKLLYAAKLALDVLAVQYEDGKGTVKAADALHAFGALREAIREATC